jgi:hypothetical protein
MGSTIAGDDAVWDLASEIGEQLHCYMDKAWQIIHQCFCDERTQGGGRYPLTEAILGEEPIAETEAADYVYLKRPQEVLDIANALALLSEAKLREEWAALVKHKDDLGYALAYFEDMKDFYLRAAAGGWAVVFTWG